MTTRTLTLMTTRKLEGFGGILTWLIEADRRYRQARHLRDLPEHMLRDIGLDGSEAEALSRRA